MASPTHVSVVVRQKLPNVIARLAGSRKAVVAALAIVGLVVLAVRGLLPAAEVAQWIVAVAATYIGAQAYEDRGRVGATTPDLAALQGVAGMLGAVASETKSGPAEMDASEGQTRPGRAVRVKIGAGIDRMLTKAFGPLAATAKAQAGDVCRGAFAAKYATELRAVYGIPANELTASQVFAWAAAVGKQDELQVVAEAAAEEVAGAPPGLRRHAEAGPLDDAAHEARNTATGVSG